MSDQVQAASHIDQLEKRLASLHDLGVDTAGLRSQLAFARTQVNEGRVAEALNICEEVADTARRLADGSAAPPERVRTGRFTRDQLASAVHDLLAQGLFAKLMAEHRGGPDVMLEARLNALDERLRGYIGHEADALRGEQQVLREELEQVRRSVGTAVATPFAETPSASETPNAGKEPLWAARLHSILVKAIRRADAQASQIAGIVQQVASQIGSSAGSAGLTARVEALRSGISEDLRSVAERIPAAIPVAEYPEPSWSQQLGTTLQLVAERLQSTPVTSTPTVSAIPDSSPAPTPEPTAEPAWAQALREALDAVVTRLGAQPMTLVAEPQSNAEPAWSVALRESLAGAEARHQELLAVVAARTPPTSTDPALGEQLAGAFERGLHDLGTLLAAQRESQAAQRESQAAQRETLAAPQPMDDSRSALSPVTAEVEEHLTTRMVGHTTTRTDRVVPEAVVDHEAIRQMVMREVEAHLGSQHTSIIPGRRDGTEKIRSLVAAELDVRHGGAIERNGGSNDVADLRATLLRLLPDLLTDESVRRSLFAVMALEAVSKPGVMGELTGLRAFLKRELAHAAEELATKLQPA
jgi:hypothetical protein